MPRTVSRLVPEGLSVDAIRRVGRHVVVTTRSRLPASACPACGCASSRVHSRYRRLVADLPSHGQEVTIEISVRRFRCVEASCRRRIFAERVAGRGVSPFARRTERLDVIVHHCGLALGGRPAARLARRLMLPVSRDTLLRTVRRRTGVPAAQGLRRVGIDDWAWRKGMSYGTLVCDLDRRRIVDLLPDREPGTVAAWLASHPGLEIVARDRGGSYARAAAQGAPQARQVADRWHLMENASAAFLSAVRRSMTTIRKVVGATIVDVALLTSAERLQYDGYCRRREAAEVIRALARAGTSIKEIARRTDRSRNHVRDVLRGGGRDVFRSRATILAPYLEALDAEWEAGCRRGAELWRRLRRLGFSGSVRVVTEWATRRRRAEAVGGVGLGRVPSARRLARLLTIDRDSLSKADAMIVAAIEKNVPALIVARSLLRRFQTMLRARAAGDLTAWISAARESQLASFATGVAADREAIEAALTEPWSNGQTEGQITKLKLVKRQMYGRAKLDLLRARLVDLDLH